MPSLRPAQVSPRSAQSTASPFRNGEEDCISAEANRILGLDSDDWMGAPNSHFTGRSPAQVVAEGNELWVREVLRDIASCRLKPCAAR